MPNASTATADNPLYTELTLNGERVDIFTSDAGEPLPVRQGWNRVTMTTTAQNPANADNGLLLRFGPMFEEDDRSRTTMTPVVGRMLITMAKWSAGPSAPPPRPRPVPGRPPRSPPRG